MLDALARLAPDVRNTLDDLLHACPSAGGETRGLRVIVTTDLGLFGALTKDESANERDRFVVLEGRGIWRRRVRRDRAAPFPMVPWIVIDGPEDVAHIALSEPERRLSLAS